MAALLVAMAVMAILMTAALPTWKQMAQREKEEELIFRGNQYARAIGAYQRKYANASPPTIDVLIEQHFLRKKYKDPLAITEDGEFALLYVNVQAPGSQGTGRQGTQPGGAGGSSSGLLASTTPTGNIIGVASKNPAASLRTFNDRTHYNEWQFMALQQTIGAGGQGPGGAAGRGAGDGRGGPGSGPGSTFTPLAPGERGGRRGNPGGPEGPGGRGGQGSQPQGGGPQGFPQGGGRGR